MSKYYKAEDILRLLADDYYTQGKAGNLTTWGAIKDLPTIDIVHCIECAYLGDDWWCYKHEFTPIPIEDYFCKDGERIDNE